MLKYNKIVILMEIGKFDKVSNMSICKKNFLSRACLFNCVTYLVNLDLVIRHGTGREITLNLTDKGRNVYNKFLEIEEIINQKVKK